MTTAQPAMAALFLFVLLGRQWRNSLQQWCEQVQAGLLGDGSGAPCAQRHCLSASICQDLQKFLCWRVVLHGADIFAF